MGSTDRYTQVGAITSDLIRQPTQVVEPGAALGCLWTNTPSSHPLAPSPPRPLAPSPPHSLAPSPPRPLTPSPPRPPTSRDSKFKEKEGVARLGSANEWVALVLTEVARVGARGVVVAGDNEEYITAVMHHAKVSSSDGISLLLIPQPPHIPPPLYI